MVRRGKPAKSIATLSFDWDETVARLCRRDKKLAKVVKLVPSMRLQLDEFQNTFETLAESIIYQQLTGKAAATICARFRRLFVEEGWPTPNVVAQASHELLRSAGLSRAKALAIQSLAQIAGDGQLPSVEQLQTMTDEEIIESLTVIRGVGPWTVQMLLIFRLGRPDVLPVTDYGVRKGFALMTGSADLPTAKQLSAHAEKWRPYRTVGSWYMWRATEVL